MAQRKVVWTKTAVKQRKAILTYWYQRNQSISYPVKLIKLVSTRIHFITLHPLAFPKTSFPDTRVSTIGIYSLFYKFEKDTIIVTAFWDNRQSPEKLKELLDK